jgi:hypothetical protein
VDKEKKGSTAPKTTPDVIDGEVEVDDERDPLPPLEDSDAAATDILEAAMVKSLKLSEMEEEGIYPWEQMPDEPDSWFQLFHRYYLLSGYHRTVVGAYRAWKEEETDTPAPAKTTGNARYWYDKAARWDWQARAHAFDEHNRLRDASKWQSRRDELREEEWNTASDMLQIARSAMKSYTNQARKNFEIAQANLKRKRSGSNGTEVRNPQDPSGRVQLPSVSMKLRGSDVARFAELGSKLGRLASGMATDQTMNVSVQARLEEVKKERWQSVAPTLARVLAEDVSEGDEAAGEPPVADGEFEEIDETDN